MRSVDATLQAALPTAAGTFIVKCQFKRGATSETITTIRGFEINEGDLTAWVKIPTAFKPTTVNPQPLNDTIFQISRGLTIQGIDYYFASSWFVLQRIEYDDYNVIYHGHIFKSSRYTTAGDVTANTAIAAVLANSYVSGLGYSNTITYSADTEWWKTIQFYPDGKTLVLQNTQGLNNILQQKYILNLVDIGGNVLVPHDNGQVNEYEPVDPEITPITACTKLSYHHASILTKYYIWRDEASSVHTSGSNTRPQHNLGYIESTVTPFALDEYQAIKVKAQLAPPDLRLTVQDYIEVTSAAGFQFTDWYRIKETFDPDAPIPWYQTLESMNLLSNTEGGPMPSTIERAAPYTPLNVTNFDAVLSANDNNIQAAMETIDEHDHGAIPTTEQVQDIVGAMITGSNQVGIGVSYDDPTGLINFEVQESYVNDLIINHAAVLEGWIEAQSTWTYTSADSPAFVASVPDANAALLTVGNKIRLVQTTTKYFIVVAKGSPSGGNTPVTLYGGTDYTLANAAITAPHFSLEKSPFGFPLNPDKWTVKVTDTSDRTQATPTQNTWYNLGSVTISIPIGCWKVSYKVVQRVADASVALINQYSTLSTANNTESDTELTHLAALGGSAGALVLTNTAAEEKIIAVAAKTSYFLNARTTLTSIDSIAHRGDAGTTVISAVCAYL